VSVSIVNWRTTEEDADLIMHVVRELGAPGQL
jgi:hypothetical protein